MKIRTHKLRLKLVSLAFAAVMGAGCTTTDPSTGESRVSKTTKGAGIGAAAGAVLGALTSSSNDRGKGALIGATAGGLIGAGVGQYQDRQQRALEERMQNSGVEVKREGDTLKLVIPGNVSFPSGSSALSPQFYNVLNQVATTLAEYPSTQVQIVGHTDSVGSASSNEQLSRTRASAVSIYLGAQGIASSRMQVEGVGSSTPIASNATSEGRAHNRRVEMKIIPVQG